MYQFFVEESYYNGKYITIEGSDFNHIKNVLRMKIGEEIRISVENTGDFFCKIIEISDGLVTTEILSKDDAGTELSNKIYLFQGLPKGDKMELIIQKAVELGVYEIIPIRMKNCVMKLDEKRAAKKIDRWNGISLSAAKQSKRSIIPKVTEILSWKDALIKANELDITLVPYENEKGMEATREYLSSIKKGQNIGIIIGPEGGFDSSEIEMVYESKNMKSISLGRRILRTETAGLATLSMLIYQLDD